MITDAQLRVSQAQTLVGAAATTVSTNVIDLLSGSSSIGRGSERRVFSEVTTALAGGTSVKADLIGSANSDLSSATVIVGGPVVLEAAAIAGKKLLDVVVPDTAPFRYIGIQYTTVGTHTAGAVWGGIVANTDQQPYLTANTGL